MKKGHGVRAGGNPKRHSTLTQRRKWRPRKGTARGWRGSEGSRGLLLPVAAATPLQPPGRQTLSFGLSRTHLTSVGHRLRARHMRAGLA